MKIIALTRYSRKGASSRMRFHIFFEFLISQGHTIKEENLLGDEYLKDMYSGNKKNFFYIIRRYLLRIFVLSTIYKYDIIWLEKEILPNCPAIFERLLRFFGIKVIVDFDDAVFHNYDQLKLTNPFKFLLRNKIDVVMRNSSLVVCGNSYIANRANEAGSHNTCIIPTVIDLNKYKVTQRRGEKIIIGWIGTPVTDHSLDLIIPALEELTLEYKFVVKLIGSKKVISNIDTIHVPWSEERESIDLEGIDIGIMPLKDNPMEKGKCGYKLLQYMASGKPVIGSSVGVNKEIIMDGVNGFLAKDHQDWVNKLAVLMGDEQKRVSFGNAGRRQVEEKYELNFASKLLVNEFKKLKEQY